MLKQLYRFLHPKFQSVFLDYKVNPIPRYTEQREPHPLLYNQFSKNHTYYTTLLQSFLLHKEAIGKIRESKKEGNPDLPSWNNGFLPGLDIIALYGMLAHFKPKNYIEVGSGNSTKVAYKAIKERQLSTTITSIDPYPRAEIDNLADKVTRVPFENTTLDFVNDLNENDILFIDNSHRVLPNSDSMVFFMEVLPFLKKGVIVQIHDIYLPYDYPKEMCDRFYSEQYALACYLIANPNKYKVILPNYYISTTPELASIVDEYWKLPNLTNVEKHGGSIWIQIGE